MMVRDGDPTPRHPVPVVRARARPGMDRVPPVQGLRIDGTTSECTVRPGRHRAFPRGPMGPGQRPGCLTHSATGPQHLRSRWRNPRTPYPAPLSKTAWPTGEVTKIVVR